MVDARRRAEVVHPEIVQVVRQRLLGANEPIPRNQSVNAETIKEL
jgi:hypothetical protein